MFTTIGRACVVECAVIGQGCCIGDNSVLSPRVILKDYVTVLPGSVVPPDMVVPPFAIVAGAPARIVGENPESLAVTSQADAKDAYHRFAANAPQ
jgi:dynactin-5